MMNDHPCVDDELTVWFKQRLARADVQFGDEPMSYGANTQLDQSSWVTWQVLPVDGGFNAIRPMVKA